MTCRGKLTVGGKDILSRNQQFRVRAGYVGKGDLNALLSVTVTPQADGRFELAGLTPGKYRVQAAMDGIWLSASKELTVGPDAAQPAQLDLNIDEPGPGSRIEIVDAQGKPRPGVELTVQRPAGPLADALWPAQLFSDGAGIIHIPPLEAGAHAIRVAGMDRKLVVAPLAEKQAETKTLRIVVN